MNLKINQSIEVRHNNSYRAARVVAVNDDIVLIYQTEAVHHPIISLVKLNHSCNTQFINHVEHSKWLRTYAISRLPKKYTEMILASEIK